MSLSYRSTVFAVLALATGCGAPAATGVVLNEVNCEGADFVELYNAGSAAVDLSGWVLNDEPDDDGWVVPPETVLPPGGWVVWYRDEDAGVEGFPFGLRCGADGETVTLFDDTGAEVDRHYLADVPVGAVHGRLPDGGDWGLADATPNQANVAFVARNADAWFAIDRVRRLDIQIPDASLASLAPNPRTWAPATLAIPAEEIGPFDIAIRLKGGYGSFIALGEGKSGFRVDLDPHDDGQALYGLQQLTLNNMVQDSSMLHEFAAFALFRGMGVPAPRVAWVQVTVNGVDFGLYLTVERHDDDMLARWFPETTHLYEGAYGQDLFASDVYAMDVDEGSDSDRADLAAIVELMETVGVGGFYEASADVVNWDSVVRALATEVWIGHWDGYGPTRNNYFLHFDGDQRMSLLPWGTDQTFSDQWEPYAGDGLLLQSCLANTTCATDYAAALREVGALAVSLGLVDAVQAQAAFLSPFIEADPRYDMGSHDYVVSETLDFLRVRGDALGAELACLLAAVPDPDGDGVLCSRDCNPSDGSVYPGAVDTCGDGVDQDCSGYPDDDLSCPDCLERTLATGTYLFCPTLRTFAGAAEHCAANGAVPVEIASDAENDAVWEEAASIRDGWWWIGLSDSDEEGVYRWANGAESTFVAWAENEPNNDGNEDCAHFYGSSSWNDSNCDVTNGVICERD